MGYTRATGDHYNLPYNVPANQYLTIKGSKISTSRRLAIWVPDYLTRYDPDPLRYTLAATMPETSDTDFTWATFVAAKQRRAGRDVGEPGEPRADVHVQELRRCGANAGRSSRTTMRR